MQDVLHKYCCYIAGIFPATTPNQWLVQGHDIQQWKCLPYIVKNWYQTVNICSSVLPTKCWPLLDMIRACSWRWPDVVNRISALFSKFAINLFLSTGATHLPCYITLNDWTHVVSEFCFNHISVIPSTSSCGTLRFSGNRIHYYPRYQSLNFWINIVTFSHVGLTGFGNHTSLTVPVSTGSAQKMIWNLTVNTISNQYNKTNACILFFWYAWNVWQSSKNVSNLVIILFYYWFVSQRLFYSVFVMTLLT